MKGIASLLLLFTVSKFASAQLSYSSETFSCDGFNVVMYKFCCWLNKILGISLI